MKKYKIHSVKYNFAMNVILKMSSYIFPLITLPYISRVLGTEANGKISFTASVITYFLMFAQLGIPTYGIRECARCRDDEDKLTKTVQELLIINGISMLIAYIILGISVLFINKLKQESTLLMIQSLTILLNVIGMEWLYQAVEQYQYITFRNIAFKLISIALMFLWVHRPEDYIIYGGLTVLSGSGSYILNLWNSRKILKCKLYTGQYEFKRHMKPIITFFALSIAVSIYTSMDTVMLGLISNDKEVAYYALATKIKMVLATTISAIGSVLLPRITYCLKHKEIDRFHSYIGKSLHFVSLVAFPMAVYFILLSSDVISILGGKEYMPAIKCMQIVTLAIVPLGFGNIATSQILTPTGRERFIMYSTICGAVINLIANAIMIPKWGADGAAFATVIAESIIAFVQICYSWNDMQEAIKKVKWYTILFSNGIAFVILKISLNFLKIQNPFVEMIMMSIVYFGSYLGGLIIFCDEFVCFYIDKILNIIDPSRV